MITDKVGGSSAKPEVSKQSKEKQLKHKVSGYESQSKQRSIARKSIKKVYNCNDANHVVNIKNLLEYSPSYAEKAANNEFFFLDTSRNPEEREFGVSGTNQLAKRRFCPSKSTAGYLIHSKH